MKSFLHSPLVFTLLGLLFLQISPLPGQTTAEKVKKIPFHGKIEAIDPAAQTLTLNGKTARVLHLAPGTKVIDGNGNPTTFSTAAVGEAVSGSYTKEPTGALTLASLRIGAKAGGKTGTEETASVSAAPTPAVATPIAATSTTTAPTAVNAPTATTPARKGAFSGKVTAVDAGAGTFSIKARTFTVDGSSKITDATGAASSLAAVAVGTKVSGSYEKAAGATTMTVVTLKIAK